MDPLLDLDHFRNCGSAFGSWPEHNNKKKNAAKLPEVWFHCSVYCLLQSCSQRDSWAFLKRYSTNTHKFKFLSFTRNIWNQRQRGTTWINLPGSSGSHSSCHSPAPLLCWSCKKTVKSARWSEEDSQRFQNCWFHLLVWSSPVSETDVSNLQISHCTNSFLYY